MTNRKTTRRALVLSILSLLVCCSMLVGTTFAWFTDSVTSGNNKIVAGNLDVEVYYGDPAAKNSIEKVNTLFNDVTLWEPGVVAYENLTVVNEGTLALKYQMAVNFTNENTVDGYGLSQILKVGVVAGGIAENSTREQAVAAVTQWQPMQSFTWNGELAAKTADETVGLVIYWEPSSDDNNWNVNNGKVVSDFEATKLNELHIDLGIELFATQVEAELDSFGPDYDAGAPWIGKADTDWYFDDPEAAEFAIDSAEELAGLAALVNGVATAPATTYAADAAEPVQEGFSGKVIKLGGNIDLNGMNWTPIGDWDHTFEGTFDGQGYTIKNLIINAPKMEGVGLFGVVEKATLKGINIENADILAYSMVAGVVGAAYPANISDCHITGDINIVADWAYVAGVAGYCNYGTQVDGCSVIAEGTGLIKSNTRNAVGGITAWLLEGDHKVTNCQVKNLNLVGWTNVGGITGFVHYNNTIEGCSVENVKLTKTRLDGNPGIGLIAGGWSYSATNAITLRNNAIKNATLEGSHIAYSAYNVLYGSEYGGATTSNFVLENNTQENITNKLVEVTKANDSTSLSDALNKGEKEIVLAAGEYTLPSMSDKDGVTIEGVEGTVIGGENASTGFGRNFGKNNTYKNLTFTGTSNGVRESYGNGGTVTFENCTFAGGSTYGFHIGESYGATFIFNNCTFSGFNAFASDLEKVVFNDCTFLHNGSYGHTNIWSVGEFNDCTFGDKTSVSQGYDSKEKKYYGTLIFDGVEESYHHEFIGTTESLVAFNQSIADGDTWKGQKVVLVDDISLGGVQWNPTKGFAGTFDGDGHTIANLTVSGTSEVAFFQQIASTAVIENVTFDNANVSGEHYVGVIVGWEGNEIANATIRNCTVMNSTITCNTDAANDNGDKAGGIVGYAVSLNINGCTVKNTTIKAYRDFGGIAGYAHKSTVITGNTVENITLVIDNEVNYKNYTTDAEHDGNPIVGEAVAEAIVENNTVK